MLKRIEDDLATLPYLLSWLEHGPAASRQAALRAKRSMLLRQLPVALFFLSALLVARAVGWVEAKGDAHFLAHWCATLAFLWPSAPLALARAASKDARSDASLSSRLRALSWSIQGGLVMAAGALAGTMALYIYLKTMS